MVKGMVRGWSRGWSGDGQAMVRGWSGDWSGDGQGDGLQGWSGGWSGDGQESCAECERARPSKRPTGAGVFKHGRAHLSLVNRAKAPTAKRHPKSPMSLAPMPLLP
eukprot:1550722-Prymnesium_polylepis.1